MIDKTKLLNTKNRKLLKPIFYETSLSDKTHVVYTLKTRDHKGYLSLYKLFMEENDPTEYTFAIKYLLDWDHWCSLKETTWFKPIYEKWVEELETRVKSKALANLMKEAQEKDGKNTFQANKYLLEKGWKDKPTNTKGRPTKEDIKKEANRIFQKEKQVREDLERLGIS